MWKKYVKWVGKVLGAGVMAFLILTLFATFYYNPPIHVKGSSAATSYVREPGSFWARATEGFAMGKIDEQGYNNSFNTDYSNIDVLMMGSSQTEGLYVNDNQCVSYLLNQKFASDGSDRAVYNIGMSAHTFYRNVQNMTAALDTYKPASYIAIETSVLSCNPEEVNQALTAAMPELTTYQGNTLVMELQKMPYIKLLYQQYKNYSSQETAGVDDTAGSVSAEGMNDYNTQMTNQILSYIATTASDYDCEAMIYFIPEVAISEDGSLVFSADDVLRGQYSELCRQNGLLFVDMTERIAEKYKSEGILASGFSNTTIGYGHLNVDGHRMLADAIYETIKEEEK